jgi:diguanylate cyclase (GGDEF)-like protein/PAS domain S-box-containing protein
MIPNDTDARMEQSPSGSENTARPPSAPPLVLVVDDDSMMRLLVRETLEIAGFRVEEAEDGDQGIGRFATLSPDVVLLDVMMPGKDGFETCAAMRSLPSGMRTPILMMTGLDDAESVDRAYQVGATDFVTKPITWPILSHRVRYLLRASRAFDGLARSEERLADAQRLAQLGHWDWDLGRDEIYRSDEVLRILGVSRDGLAAGYRSFLPLVHPEDLATLERAIHAAAHRAEPFNLEIRVTRPDGVERIVHEQAVVSCDAHGHPIRIQGTTQDITDRRQAEERIRTLALYDTLTGLPNRLFFKEQFGHSLAQAERQNQSLAVLILNLDRFKRINETLGYDVGDRLLKQVADRLSRSLRNADYVTRGEYVPNSRNLARLGGDEFTIMLAGLSQADDVAKVARRVLTSIAKPFSLDGHEVVVTASVGIAVYPMDGGDVDSLLKNADSAMSYAKDQGKDNCQFFSPSMNATSFQKLTLENDLRRSLERGELVVHYQPKIVARTGRIAGVEALIRWAHPELGMISPMEFIPLAEEIGLIVPIGEWVLKTACAQLARWRAAGFTDMTVAVNMTSANFAQKDFVKHVVEAISAPGIGRGAVELEVTEGVLMQNIDATIATLNELKAAGVRLSIDDFGTGYSSLSYLNRFPIDTLKIDRSFVRDVIVNPEDAAITTTIIGLAHSLGLEVVAEGVETEEQAAFLREKGCHLMQGYLYSRPVPADEITSLLQAENSRGAPRLVAGIRG